MVPEEGNPAIDRRGFRQCLGQFATGVTVMTAETGGHRAGVTANSFSSVSLDPPLILWSISKTSRSFQAFAEARHFAVNILGQDQIRLSQIFSSSEADKFAEVEWSIGRHGSPVLDGVTALLECEREAVYEGGDHLIIVGRVLRFATFEGEPLIFAQGKYGVAESHPSLRSLPEAAGEATSDAAEESLMSLLFRTYHYVSLNFEDHRRAEGLTQAQARVLAALYDAAGQTTDDLARTIYLGKRDTEDAVADLAERSFVTISPKRTISLSSGGRKRREAMLARATEFEEEQLAGLTREEIVKAKKFLSRLISRNIPTWGTEQHMETSRR
jgi:flavin reductase (DIM6/NTAB) family NADH-FMN oxidoreductase RutF/DNA-binding MarR family transcriptional regulator